jgi:hypothetical protein
MVFFRSQKLSQQKPRRRAMAEPGLIAAVNYTLRAAE